MWETLGNVLFKQLREENLQSMCHYIFRVAAVPNMTVLHTEMTAEVTASCV
jgi:hypothetical protein